MKTLDDFLAELDESEAKIVQILRDLVRNTAPDFEEKISYGVPYYFRHYRVCFIWPASVKPGPKSGVVLGFCKGFLLSDEQKLLEKENRKEVYMITFHQPNEINLDVLKEIILEAILVDEEVYKERKKKKSIK
jgi:uncharacterized protein YdhG (YjbR/CyaY superfamily)